MYLILLFIIYIFLSFKIKISIPSSLGECGVPNLPRDNCLEIKFQLNSIILLSILRNALNSSNYRFPSIRAILFRHIWLSLIEILLFYATCNDDEGNHWDMKWNITSLRFGGLWVFPLHKLVHRHIEQCPYNDDEGELLGYEMKYL